MLVAVSSDDRLLTRKEAAEFLGLAPQTLAVWASTRRYDLPYIRVGRAVRYRFSALSAFLERNTFGHGVEAS